MIIQEFTIISFQLLLYLVPNIYTYINQTNLLFVDKVIMEMMPFFIQVVVVYNLNL